MKETNHAKKKNPGKKACSTVISFDKFVHQIKLGKINKMKNTDYYLILSLSLEMPNSQIKFVPTDKGREFDGETLHDTYKGLCGEKIRMK